MKKIFYLLIIILFSNSILAIEPTVDNQFMCTLDNDDLTGSDPNDISPNGYNGIDNGSTTGVSGWFNQAFAFSNTISEFPTIGTIPEGTNDFTINFWINNSDINDNRKIMGTANLDSYVAGWGIFTITADKIYLLADNTPGSPYAINYNEAGFFVQGEWMMVTLTRTGNDFQFYRNGTAFGGGSTIAESIGTGAFDFQIGGAGDDADYIGSLDEVAIWNRSLNATEVLELFNLEENIYAVINLSILNNTYNMTSDGGCTVWQNDTSTNCNTTDGTPTFTFDTNRDADCSVRATQSDSDIFPSFNSSFECGTTGGSSHICTVYNGDKLLFEQNYLYASCTDGGNATSGSLAINMTAGSGGGLIDCISIIGTGCAAVITDNCAAIIQ